MAGVGAGSAGGRTAPVDATPAVSVVIPVYNRRALLARALASVLAQTRGDFEAIVVDDASTVPLADVVAGFGDGRLRYLRNDVNRGPAWCRQLGMTRARGAYVAFLDSDDWWRPEKLELQLDAALRDSSPRVAVVARARMVEGERSYVVPERPMPRTMPVAEFLYAHGGVIHTSSVLVPTALAREVGFDPGLRFNEDTDFLIRLQAAGCAVLSLPEPLAFFDRSPDTARLTQDPALLAGSLRWFERVSGTWSPRARRGFFIGDLAMRAAGQGRTLEALGYCLRGFHPRLGAYPLARAFAFALFSGSPPAVLRRLLARLRRRAVVRESLPSANG